MAHEAYGRWAQSQKYKGIFFPADYLLAGTKKTRDTNWMDRTTAQLTKKGLKWSQLDSTASAKRAFPILSGDLASPKFTGYHHGSAGWVDASKAISQLRDECLELGVSMLFGLAGTVVGLETASGEIRGLQTASGNLVEGDTFVMSAGAWTSNLVQMYNSTLSTAQVVAYMKLTDSEMLKYKDLPIYMNFSTGWFNLPPHQDTQMLKMAVHGWGYTRALTNEEKEAGDTKASSSPPLGRRPERPNFVPSDGEERLRQGLREMLPELANRPFERVIMCWYTDSPSRDFIMDYHPDYENLFIAGAGSGQ